MGPPLLRKLSKTEALKAEESAARIGVRLIAVDVQTSLEIALEHDIYAYDACFLRCALMFSLPLLTLDRRMARVARELGIRVMEEM